MFHVEIVFANILLGHVMDNETEELKNMYEMYKKIHAILVYLKQYVLIHLYLYCSVKIIST